MITLGLDPSMTGFGWCIHNSGLVGPARIVDRGRFATSPRDIFVARYKSLRQSVSEVLRNYPQIEAVGVESPPFGELWSEGLYALFVMVNEAIYDHRRDVVYFDPGTLKFLVKQDTSVRKGKMFKSDMVDAAKADTGVTGRFNHNEADAYHVARFAARFWDLFHERIGVDDLTPSERQSFVKIHTFVRGKRAGETVRSGALFKENSRFFRFSLLERDPHAE